jgi:hypothetical protein
MRLLSGSIKLLREFIAYWVPVEAGLERPGGA